MWQSAVFFFPNGLAAHVYEKSEVTAKGFGGRGRVGSIWFNVKWSYYGLPCFAKFWLVKTFFSWCCKKWGCSDWTWMSLKWNLQKGFLPISKELDFGHVGVHLGTFRRLFLECVSAVLVCTILYLCSRINNWINVSSWKLLSRCHKPPETAFRIHDCCWGRRVTLWGQGWPGSFRTFEDHGTTHQISILVLKMLYSILFPSWLMNHRSCHPGLFFRGWPSMPGICCFHGLFCCFHSLSLGCSKRFTVAFVYVDVWYLYSLVYLFQAVFEI